MNWINEVVEMSLEKLQIITKDWSWEQLFIYTITRSQTWLNGIELTKTSLGEAVQVQLQTENSMLSGPTNDHQEQQMILATLIELH